MMYSTFLCCDVEKSQNFVIFVVLTVFGVCGVGILLLLRPIKKEEDDEKEEAEKEKDNEVCWQPSFLYHKMLIMLSFFLCRLRKVNCF